MKLRKVLAIVFVIPLASTLVLLNSQQAQAGSSQSTVGRDMTPPKVRTARNLINQGYRCVDINEYSDFTCNTPSGMDAATFSYRSEAFWGNYLGSNREWAWNCLNGRGQLWGASNGSLRCQGSMR